MRTRLVAVLLVALAAAGCGPADLEPSFDTVDELYEAAGGEQWCDGELRVTFADAVGNCGDPSGDSRVVLGVGQGGQELRSSVGLARRNLAEDDQLLLVPSQPDRRSGWQLRSRDRRLLEAARERIGGVLLTTVDELDDYIE